MHPPIRGGGCIQMQPLNDFSTSQLAELRGQTRMNVAALERKGAFRTVNDNVTLKDQRALLRRLTKEIKARVVQRSLF